MPTKHGSARKTVLVGFQAGEVNNQSKQRERRRLVTSEGKKWRIAEPGDTNLRLVTASGRMLARSYDYVIVGAGSAGCVVSRRLVDGTDATVLLLEAGGPGDGVTSLSNPPQWVENLGSPYDWAYRYEPSPHVAH